MSVLDIKLQDMLVKVPAILQKLLQRRSDTIKMLRLVSKEVGRLAMTAVTQCEVHLDQNNQPSSPLRLARLIAGARLQKMTVTIRLVSGGRTKQTCLKLGWFFMTSWILCKRTFVVCTVHHTLPSNILSSCSNHSAGGCKIQSSDSSSSNDVLPFTHPESADTACKSHYSVKVNNQAGVLAGGITCAARIHPRSMIFPYFFTKLLLDTAGMN